MHTLRIGASRPACDRSGAVHRPNQQAMPTFSYYPNGLEPVAEAVRYSITSKEPATVNLRLEEARTGQLLATKRLVGVTSADLDAAPVLRRTFRFLPTEGESRIHTIGERICMLVATIDGSAATTAEGAENSTATTAEGASEPLPTPPDPVVPDVLTTPAALFFASNRAVTAPEILTTLPAKRTIGPRECDELTIYAEHEGSLTVEATTPAGVTRRQFPFAVGAQLFRLNAADYPAAEQLRVVVEGVGTVEYAVQAVPDGAVRLAWRSSHGSIEHHTFPTVAKRVVAATRREACGTEGYVTVRSGAEVRRRLLSEHLPDEVMEALWEVVVSPQVWEVTDEGYTPVRVLCDEATIHHYGAWAALEIEITESKKRTLPWS